MSKDTVCTNYGAPKREGCQCSWPRGGSELPPSSVVQSPSPVSLRDQFAMSALNAMDFTRYGYVSEIPPAKIAEQAYRMADAMLEAHDG